MCSVNQNDHLRVAKLSSREGPLSLLLAVWSFSRKYPLLIYLRVRQKTSCRRLRLKVILSFLRLMFINHFQSCFFSASTRCVCILWTIRAKVYLTFLLSIPILKILFSVYSSQPFLFSPIRCHAAVQHIYVYNVPQICIRAKSFVSTILTKNKDR